MSLATAKAIYLHVVALMVVTAFSEEAVVYDVVYIQLVEQGITVLEDMSV
jgi:hypothetical protein